MSLVVEQTLPYSKSELKLEDPQRWRRLLPLLRPSIKLGETASGQTILVDRALARTKNTPIAAIGYVGNLSSKILSGSHLAAFGPEQFEKQSVTAEDVVRVLKDAGFSVKSGVVVLHPGLKQDFRPFPGGVEVAVAGELRFDHVLSLLAASNAETRASFEKTKALLEQFVKAAATTTSTFHEKKIGSGPSVVHAVEVAEFKSARKAIDRDLSHLLSSRPRLAGDVVYSVHYSDINGLSRLENNILAHEVFEYLAKRDLKCCITQSTIADTHCEARGWAISLCAVPTTFLSPQLTPSNALATTTTTSAPSTKPREGSSKVKLSDTQVRNIITAGCDSVIKDEPTITEYDTIVGDGDCGYTLRDGAKQVLQFIDTADLSNLASTLSALVDDLEVNMGGTSGALYCIFLASLAQELWTAPTFPDALKGALEHLLKYTRARLGDRTCLDCLIPFVETLQRTGDSGQALMEAEKGVESTKTLEAKLGRSSYLDEAATRGVPDPGAYGLLKLLEGMVGAK